MDHLSKNIAFNLKKIRQCRKMSLDDVSGQTGVSKSMLGQIERGDSNPTITTVCKIVSGLKISMDNLIEPPVHDTYIVNKQKLAPAKEKTGKYLVYEYFPFTNSQEFEIYGMELLPSGIYSDSSHGEKTTEYLVINQGTLTLKVGNEFFDVNAGDALCFESDKEHQYINNGVDIVKFTSFFVVRKNVDIH